jgi:hypothetical protein
VGVGRFTLFLNIFFGCAAATVREIALALCAFGPVMAPTLVDSYPKGHDADHRRVTDSNDLDVSPFAHDRRDGGDAYAVGRSDPRPFVRG